MSHNYYDVRVRGTWKTMGTTIKIKKEGGEKMEFEIGDRVLCIESYECVKSADTGTVVNIPRASLMIGIRWDRYVGGHDCQGACDNGYGYYVPEDCLSKSEGFNTIKQQTTKEKTMNINSTVAKVFKNTDDAILVSKYFGSEYEENNFRAYLSLKKNEKEVLKEAKEREEEENVRD